MRPRLSELLERIRPAGAPGAPTEGESAALRRWRADEIADVVAALVTFEAEVDATIAAARRDAAQIVGGGERRAREIIAGTADRVAAVQVETEQRSEAHDDAETERATSARIAVMQARADHEISGLVAHAVESIWTAFVPDARREASR